MTLRWMTAALAVALSASAAAAQTDSDAPYEGDRFAITVEEIADGVHVMIREPSWRLPVQANTGLIVNETDAVLIDGGFTAHAENVVEAVREITDKPVSAIITTHWHGDHNIGHHVFRREWPDARIIAHDNTRAAMTGDDMDYIAQTASRSDAELLAPMRERIAELEAEDGAPSVLAYLRDAAEGAPTVRDDYADWTPVPADTTFSERLTLHRGDRRIEILYFGLANTRGDAVIWLPDERIVFSGDTVVRPTPYGFGSFPASWGDVLRDIAALDYAILVPGHGDLQRDTAYVTQLAEMMDAIARQACAAVAEGAEDGAAVRDAIDWAPFESAFTHGDPLLERHFEVWFKRPIGAAALAEIEEGETNACD